MGSRKSGTQRGRIVPRLKVPQSAIDGWEETGTIEIPLVEKLAAATKIPFGYLFLGAPPKETLPISDFRRVGAAVPAATPSRALLSVIYQCQRRQEWFREYLIQNGYGQLPFVGKFTPDTPIEQAASEISETLKLGAKFNREYKNWEEAMRRNIENIEDAGILVNRIGYAENYTHNTLSVEEFRGFALSDKYAPLIFINGADAPTAQMFTMAHEAVHIWLGESGVSNLDQTFAGDYRTEIFCNSVAAEILVPLKLFISEWNKEAVANREIERLAKIYRVSGIVVARRALDAGFVTRATYKTFYNRVAVKPSGGVEIITLPSLTRRAEGCPLRSFKTQRMGRQ
ncbi:MAG: ImmA/IrrE family metallo-endopeptidase [Chthoniobacter sp.]